MKNDVKMKLIHMGLAAVALGGMSSDALAIQREDVLECGLPDGSKFILRSRYDFSLVPIPLGHHSRESDRLPWQGHYLDKSGRLSEVPTSIHYSNKELSELAEVCANFGMRNGHPLARFTYQRDDGKWQPLDSFPWSKLHVNVGASPDELTREQRSAMERVGIKRSAYMFAYILPKDGRLVYEQPLHKTYSGYTYSLPIEAVYQSFSEDGGKTWAPPMVTSKAEIFEIGKSRIGQSTRARPILINKKIISASFLKEAESHSHL